MLGGARLRGLPRDGVRLRVSAANRARYQPPARSKSPSTRLSSGASVRNARRLEIAYQWPRLLTRHQKRQAHAVICPGLPLLSGHRQRMRHTGGAGSNAGRRLIS